DREGDRQKNADPERPTGRAERDELRPLREQDARLRDAAAAVQAGDGYDCACAAHAASSSRLSTVSDLNSTSPRVSSMNASSSDACNGVNSCRTIWFAAASSPTCCA